jgi:hypothetical protein
MLFLACLLISSEAEHCIADCASFIISPAQASENRSSTRPKLNAKLDKWYIFRGPDGDFTLQFPRKPDIQDISEGPITLIRYYGVTTDDGTTFSVNFQDIGGDPRASQNNEWSKDLEENMSIADSAQNRQIVQTHRVGKSIIGSGDLANSGGYGRAHQFLTPKYPVSQSDIHLGLRTRHQQQESRSTALPKVLQFDAIHNATSKPHETPIRIAAIGFQIAPSNLLAQLLPNHTCFFTRLPKNRTLTFKAERDQICPLRAKSYL